MLAHLKGGLEWPCIDAAVCLGALLLAELSVIYPCKPIFS